jgi:hypothetical protein
MSAITPCPSCGTISSESYAGTDTCWSCFKRSGAGDISLRVRSADLSRARPPRWAWQDLIVLGYLNLLIGNEGVGKGALITKLIALLTRGELPGDLRGQQVGVGVLGDEDSFDGVWAPRLHAAGADLNLVVQIDRPDGGFVNVREDRAKLTQTVKQHGLQVLFFDQLLDNLGAGTDDWRQKPVRDAPQPLRALARELDIAVVGNLHPNKRATTFRELIAGTVAFNSVSRSGLLLAQHPEDEDVRVLVRGKGNLSQIPPAMEFSHHQQEVRRERLHVQRARDRGAQPERSDRRRPRRHGGHHEAVQRRGRGVRDHRSASTTRRRLASRETDPRGVHREQHQRAHGTAGEGQARRRTPTREGLPRGRRMALADH